METNTFILFGEGIPDVLILRADQPRGVQWRRDIVPAIGRLAQRVSSVKHHGPGNWFWIDAFTGDWDKTKFQRYVLSGKDFTKV